MRDTRLVRLLGAPKLLAMLVVGLLLGALGGAAIASGDQVINACYDTTNGNLRLVTSAGDCRKPENFISWNQQGIPGAPGPQGDKGAKGDKGDPGAPAALKATVRLTGHEFESSHQTFSILSHCHVGEIAVGGGFYKLAPSEDVTIDASSPLPQSGTPTSWQVNGTKRLGPKAAVQVYAVCVTSSS